MAEIIHNALYICEGKAYLGDTIVHDYQNLQIELPDKVNDRLATAFPESEQVEIKAVAIPYQPIKLEVFDKPISRELYLGMPFVIVSKPQMQPYLS